MLSSIELPRIQALDTAGRAKTRPSDPSSRTRVDSRRLLICTVIGLFVLLLAGSAVLLRHLEEVRRLSATEQQAATDARARMAALATRTVLESSTGSIPDDIVRTQRLISRLASSGDLTGLQLGLYFTPRSTTQWQTGLLVASSPTREFESPFTPLADRFGLDIIQLLKSTCRTDAPLPQPARWSYTSEGYVLTLNPVVTSTGCWGIVTMQTAPVLATVSLGLLPLDFANSMAGVALFLAALLSAALLFHFRHVLTVLWSVVDGPRGEALAGVYGGIAQPRGPFSPASPVVPAAMPPQIASGGMDRDGLEELAHGLKTPVATIIQSLEPLRRTAAADDLTAQRSLQIIETASRRLIDLIQAIPGRSAGKADKHDGRMMGVAEIVHGAVNGLDTAHSDVRLRLIDMTSGDADLAGNPSLLRAAIEHVVENAIDFSPPGGEVSVRITAGRSLAIVAIEDQGPGVPPGKLPMIFNRYFSDRASIAHDAAAKPPPDRPPPNFGLGLWIARRNIEALRGRIVAENRQSGGLRVTISLPLAQAYEH